MAKKPVVDVKSPGAQDVLKQRGVARDIERRLNQIAAAAGPGHEVRVRVGKTRVRGTVRTATRAARRAEATKQNLSRAIDRGRD